ncbi:MAG: alkaline shock response membrane anchor protein AmaP [Clostridiales bacterium]|nr:alkaline shock response membrane anchor protein AmaP [Clostridiales bacterium]
MKPRLIDKLLLGLVLILFIGIMVVCALTVTGVIPQEDVSAFLDTVMSDGIGYGYLRIGIVIVCAVLAVIAIKLLFTSGKPKEKEASNASLLSSDENGAAYISAASIDSMAQKYIKSNSRIRECSSKVGIDADSRVNISLKAIVLADTNIPELCEKVRTELKEYIETYAGVKVSQIDFMVVNTYSPTNASRLN